MDQLVGREFVGVDIKQLLHLFGQGNLLEAAFEQSTACRNQFLIIIGPVRARQIKQPLAFVEAGLGIRIGVDEDMLVIECRYQLQAGRQQHAVAEHIAGHIANTDHRDRIGLHIEAQFAEMPLH